MIFCVIPDIMKDETRPLDSLVMKLVTVTIIIGFLKVGNVRI